ncbi:MAG: type 4a pilus biogenesis protein PilO [Elusimicrobia bacterium]|nr:type 4a pilus biogenesis protein PilO [Elusimicrobiota bacterium]
MKIGDKKSLQQKQVAIMAVVVVAVILFLFKSFMYDQLQGKISAIEVKLKEAKAKLAEANSIADKKEIIDKELTILQHKLAYMSEMLPQKKEIPKFLKTIATRANDHSIRLLTFQPTAIITSEFYNEVPVTVNIRGSFNNLGQFFAKVGNLNRIVNVENVQLTATPGENSKETIGAVFTIKTFTYTEGGVY